MASPSTLARIRFTTKPGVSRVMTAFFFSVLATCIAVASVSSVVCGVRTTSMSGITATGLKKWNPTRRSGFASRSPMRSTDRLDVLVARMAVAETCCSISANTCCFTLSSSNTASMTQSASAKSALSVVPVTSAVSRLASSGEMRPFSASFRISPWMPATPASTRVWSRSVMTTGTWSLRTNSRANCDAMRPAPTTPTLVTSRASALSGAPAGRFARFCTRSNA